MLRWLKQNLAEAQNRMKVYADENRTEREFSVGDWVYLELQPYRQQSVEKRSSYKLSPRFYGPFQVLAKIGSIAYKLDLPHHAKIHPVFHVSLLKKKMGEHVSITPTLPPYSNSGYMAWIPEMIIDRGMFRKGNAAITKYLVQWQGLPPEDATWIESSEFESQFQNFQA